MKKTWITLFVLSSGLLCSCISNSRYERFLEIAGTVTGDSVYLIVAKENGRKVTYISPDPKPTFYPKEISFYSYSYYVPPELQNGAHVSPVCKRLLSTSADRIPSDRKQFVRQYVPKGAIFYEGLVDDVSVTDEQKSYIHTITKIITQIRYSVREINEQWFLVCDDLQNNVYAVNYDRRVSFSNRIEYDTSEYRCAGDVFDPRAHKYAVFYYDISRLPEKRMKLSDKALIWQFDKNLTKTFYLDPPSNSNLFGNQ